MCVCVVVSKGMFLTSCDLRSRVLGSLIVIVMGFDCIVSLPVCQSM